MGIYEDLGVRPVINAIGTPTRFGGALMNPEVLETMSIASQEFCLLDELHEKAGERIAEMLPEELRLAGGEPNLRNMVQQTAYWKRFVKSGLV